MSCCVCVPCVDVCYVVVQAFFAGTVWKGTCLVSKAHVGSGDVYCLLMVSGFEAILGPRSTNALHYAVGIHASI
jgi:hypothetical protein